MNDPLKLVFIYRQPCEEAYSLEGLFHTVAEELKKQAEVIEYHVGRRANFLMDAWNLRRLDADIYHVTGDVNYLILLLPRKKTVLTVHDIGHYLFGLRGVKRWLYKWLWLILPMRFSRAVTVVSQETRRNILQLLGTSTHLQVIENCYNRMFKKVPGSFNKERPVILQVGTKPYKNVPRLIEALKGINAYLVLVGSLDDATRKKLTECQVRFDNHTDLTQEELIKLYASCDMVSFVSTGEGFGLPIIEAQAVGRPVITANIPPMSEVAGDGACLVDPLDVQDIRAGIKQIISDGGYRERIIASGFRNIARYSPAAISGQYLDLYMKLAVT